MFKFVLFDALIFMQIQETNKSGPVLYFDTAMLTAKRIQLKYNKRAQPHTVLIK